ncbi:hypothetical protein J6590_033064 [Homalodisca vitripennis]|nr:hypothetical protein J6590_033064 [Homalodisca vitripennis]
MESFKSTLATQKSDTVYQTENTNTAFNIFHNTIQTAFDSSCPLKTFKNKRYKNQIWDSECTRLKDRNIQALEKEQCAGLTVDKTETANQKKDYDMKLINPHKRIYISTYKQCRKQT